MALIATPALAQTDAGTTVTAPREHSPGAVSLRGDEARDTPMVEHDALRSVQTLAGVGRSPLGSADVSIWGAAPGQTRVVIDGMDVPALYHLGGYRSVLSPALVGKLELEPAPFRPEVGRGLGGQVTVGTADVEPGWGTVLSSDLAATSGFVAAANERASIAAAAEASTLPLVFRNALSGPAADRFALPDTFDAQLKATYAIGPSERVSLLGLLSSDRLTARVSSDDPSLERARAQRREFYRLGLNWLRVKEDESLSVTVYGGFDRRLDQIDTPLASALADGQSFLGGARAHWRSQLNRTVALVLGFDGLFTRSYWLRDGPLTLPPREGDVTAFGEPLSDDRAVDRWQVSGLDASLYAGADLELGPVRLLPALRLAAISSVVSRATPKAGATPAVGVDTLDFSVEPRLTASWQLSSALALTAAGGLSHQAPDSADQSAVFGGPVLHPAHGKNVALGALFQPAPVVALEATGFYSLQDALAVRDPAVQARLADLLIQTGEGRAEGVEVTARARPWSGLTAVLAYTLSRAERRDSATGSWRLADFDQTHVLNASALQRFGAWRIGARARWATGLPRSPVVASVFDVRRGVYDPSFGAPNSTRLPDFFSLDLEAGRAFTFQRLSVELYVEVFNVTNHHNVEEWVYDSSFTRRAPLYGLPIFGTLGLRVSL
ncbi:MAG: TonB-dependent receptor [Myxococcaceae bacterium]